MGGGTGTGGSPNQYTAMTLDQPWGESEEQVRIFPPCQVRDRMNSGDAVMVFIKGGKVWKRKRIGYVDFFPSAGFIAWDDSNQEYAWHEVGTIDVPGAVDPTLTKRSPFIRGESEPVGSNPPRRAPRVRAKRRTFMEWFLNKSNANETPDYLRRNT